VLYQGQTRWKVRKSFSVLLDWEPLEKTNVPVAALLQKYLPDFEYHLYDFSVYSDEEIRGAVFLQTTLLLKNVHRPDLGEKLLEIFSRLSLHRETPVLEYLRTLLIYIAAASNSIAEPQIKRALCRVFNQNQGERMATFLDTWIQQGLQQGLQQGKQEGFLELTLRLLEKRLGKITVAQRKVI
jgi:hypothetical protein